MIQRSHYHVVEHTPGYMPDTEAATYANRRDALAYAVSLARELREQGYRVSGSGGNYYAERSRSDLGRCIETVTCVEDCEG